MRAIRPSASQCARLLLGACLALAGPGRAGATITSAPGAGSLAAAVTAARYGIEPARRPRTPAPGGAYEAFNPAQALRATFTGKGVRVSSAGDRNWRLGLTLKGYGRGDQLLRLTSGTMRTQGNRIEISRRAGRASRPSSLVEWYVNTPSGLEQGFTLAAPPGVNAEPGALPSERVRLTMIMTGGLRGEATEDGQAIVLKDERGRRTATYAHLKAWDATGRELPARMRVNRRHVSLEVDDRGARYPVTVDPTLQQEVQLRAADGATLGHSVAIHGSTAIVGDPLQAGRAGAVYVFVRSGTTWLQQAKLTADDGAADAHFGWSVAFDGSALLVGAPNIDVRPIAPGSVYVFGRSGTKWIQQQKLTASNAAGYDLFGLSVAISGDTAFVGAPNRSADRATGIVWGAYVFVSDGTTWTEQQKLHSGVQYAARFGTSVALHGGTAIIGSPGDSPPEPPPSIDYAWGTGAAYVFERSGTSWVKSQRLTASDAAANSFFGTSVALNGDTILVGAPADPDPDWVEIYGDNPGPGTAYVFDGSGGTWLEQQRIAASDGGPRHRFGDSVAIRGGTALVGARRNGAGAAYVLEWGSGVWAVRERLAASDLVGEGAFGASVGMSGDTMIVGAPDASAAYVFTPPDADGDGLPDAWEISGLTVGPDDFVSSGDTGDGVFIDLPSMGADPRHKDIFVHVDWMEPGPTGTVLKPRSRAIRMVSDAFATAPVPNPNGKTGIHLHADLGPDSLMNPVTGAPWGTLSRSGAVPFQETIGEYQDNLYSWSAVDDAKAIHFAATARRVAFHYALFANSFSPDGASGVSRGFDATDFLVTLGKRPTPGGTVEQQASIFMHELGHNLGLHHGGGDDINRKPNYLSVMNYRFLGTGLLRPWGFGTRRDLDFSRGELPPLDERDLDEFVGIRDPALHLTTWSFRTRPDVPPGSNRCLANRDGFFTLFLPSDALDWDCDGAKTPTPVVADVNSDGYCVGTAPGSDVLHTVPSGDDEIRRAVIVSGSNRICETVASGGDEQKQPVGFIEPDVLRGFDDWPALVFNGGGVVGAGPGPEDPARSFTRADEPTTNDLLELVPPGLTEEELLAPEDVVTHAPQAGNAPLTVRFDGTASTAVTGTIVEWHWDFGDGSTGSGATPSHTYTTQGTYFATLTVTDGDGRVNLVSLLHRVTVGAGPAPTTTTTTTTVPSTTTTSPATSTTTSTTTPGPGPTPGAGDVDRAFTATATVNVGQVHAVVIRPDGKTVVGGEFESFAGCPRRGVARLLPDGSCDPSFDPGLALTRVFQTNLGGVQRGTVLVQALALQPDGKLLVGIGYSAFVGQTPLLFRLHPDGTRDPSFDASSLDASASATPGVSAIARQPDGRIVVGGVFGYGNAGSKANIVRLEANGSLDPSFIVPSGTPFGGTNARVSALGLQADGKVVIGGAFSCVGFGLTCSAPHRRLGIARLESDGRLDASFNVQDAVTGRFASGLELASEVFDIAVQPDGRLLLAGILRAADGSITPVARLDTNGSRDGTFANPFGVGGVFDARGLALQADGKVVVGGQFQVASPLRTRIARLNTDGTFDVTFDPGGGFDGSRRFVYAVASHADGRVVVGGDFTAFDGTPAESIVQLGADGRRDASFASRGPGQNGEVLALVRQPDGKLLVGMVGGLFDYQRLNATQRNGIGRLNPDGSTDPSFTSPLSANATVAGITLQPDGKVIVTGSFTAGSRTDFARLNADGSLDASFDPQVEGGVAAVVVQPAGKVIIGGNFTRLNGAFVQRIARLDATGGTDASFTATIPAGGVAALAVQPDGRILVGGVFATVNSTPRNNLARLEPDGSLDMGFDPGGGPDAAVDTLLPRADGRIVIGGWFRNYGGTPRDGMARVHANGSLDASFDPVNPSGRRRGGMAQDADGRVVVGSLYRGDTALPPPNRVLRLGVDGQLDPTFVLGTGVEGFSVNVNAILLDADDGIVIGGEFDVVNGAARLGLARLLGATQPSPTTTTSTTLGTASSTTVTTSSSSSSTVATSSSTTVSLPPVTSTTLPCMLSALPADSLAGVVCAIAAVRRTLGEPPLPACTGCKACSLESRLYRIAGKVMEAEAATSTKKCKRGLKAARGGAKSLRSNVLSLTRRNCLAPADRAATLAAQVEDLGSRTKAVSKGPLCNGR